MKRYSKIEPTQITDLVRKAYVELNDDTNSPIFFFRAGPTPGLCQEIRIKN